VEGFKSEHFFFFRYFDGFLQHKFRGYGADAERFEQKGKLYVGVVIDWKIDFR
jgi:hypothetical protein